jgi:ABC-type histidine transport system ATPase subunit
VTEGRAVPVLDVKGLRKRFGTLTVLDGISLRVDEGEVVSIIGASGSGKSTFLRCLMLFEEPDEGDVTIAGMRLPYGCGAGGTGGGPGRKCTRSGLRSAWSSSTSTSSLTRPRSRTS